MPIYIVISHIEGMRLAVVHPHRKEPRSVEDEAEMTAPLGGSRLSGESPTYLLGLEQVLVGHPTILAKNDKCSSDLNGVNVRFYLIEARLAHFEVQLLSVFFTEISPICL